MLIRHDFRCRRFGFGEWRRGNAGCATTQTTSTQVLTCGYDYSRDRKPSTGKEAYYREVTLWDIRIRQKDCKKRFFLRFVCFYRHQYASRSNYLAMDDGGNCMRKHDSFALMQRIRARDSWTIYMNAMDNAMWRLLRISRRWVRNSWRCISGLTCDALRRDSFNWSSI